MAFKQLSSIDTKTKLTVHGWVRNKEKSLRLRHVPSMIKAICILYFREDDIFEIAGDDLKISKDKKSVKAGTTSDDFSLLKNNCYGIIEIPSMNNTNIYEDDLLTKMKTMTMMYYNKIKEDQK